MSCNHTVSVEKKNTLPYTKYWQVPTNLKVFCLLVLRGVIMLEVVAFGRVIAEFVMGAL